MENKTNKLLDELNRQIEEHKEVKKLYMTSPTFHNFCQTIRNNKCDEKYIMNFIIGTTFTINELNEKLSKYVIAYGTDVLLK